MKTHIRLKCFKILDSNQETAFDQKSVKIEYYFTTKYINLLAMMPTVHAALT